MLVLAAFAAVPVMLFPKPYFLKKRHEARLGRGAYAVLGENDDENDDEGGAGGAGGTAAFDYG